ncbi:hypothetical protein AWC22_23620 [Mycobacterium riyadhense]|uniref:TauD/TfdA-like domain-containing protein n=1 Tax=Mycobacterium riyadhense TaxID=486698 RepID=A0A1X2CDL0_9MYCO|nr:hypothetical protein AWC22_23620 [Mycobacterium riyadhense]
MTAADGRARRAADYLNSRLAAATQFSWDVAGVVLVIANRFVLHARGDATAEPDRRLVRVGLRVSDSQEVQTSVPLRQA